MARYRKGKLWQWGWALLCGGLGLGIIGPSRAAEAADPQSARLIIIVAAVALTFVGIGLMAAAWSRSPAKGNEKKGSWFESVDSSKSNDDGEK